MLSTILLVATATLSSLVSAQNQKPNGSAYSTSGPLTVVPSSVNLDLRISWCTGQRNNCPLICGGTASDNNCNPVSATSPIPSSKLVKIKHDKFEAIRVTNLLLTSMKQHRIPSNTHAPAQMATSPTSPTTKTPCPSTSANNGLPIALPATPITWEDKPRVRA